PCRCRLKFQRPASVPPECCLDILASIITHRFVIKLMAAAVKSSGLKLSGTAAAAGHRADSNVGDACTEISFGSIGDDESVVVGGGGNGGGGIPEQLLDSIGLAEYSNDEKFQLDSVLQRVHAAQAMDEKRKERLRQQLQTALTEASSVQERLQSGLLYTMCELCGGKLYPFSKRYVCQRCQNLACSNCVHLVHKSVQCHLCHLEFVTEAQSGEWFLAEVRRRTERAYFGPEILRASLRRERKRLVSEERMRRASATPAPGSTAAAAPAVEVGAVSKTKGADAPDSASAGAASAPPPASETRPADSGKEDAKKKKKDKKEREKEKEKAKQKQKEEKKREKRRRHSPELPPPPPPPPPVELTVIEPSAGVIVEADAQSNQEVAVVEEVNVQIEAAAPDAVDGDGQPEEQDLQHQLEAENGEAADGEAADGEAADGEAADGEAADGEAADGEAADREAAYDGEAAGQEQEEELGEPEELEAAASSGPVAPEIVVTEEIADDDEDGAAAAAAEADKASTSGTSNLRIVDAPAVSLPDRQLSLSGAALNLLKRRRSFLKLSAPPRPPPPIVEIAKRASAALLDLRLRSVLHRLQLLEKTSCESVLSNISETEDSYRGIRASGEVEISAKFSSGVLTVLVHRCRNLARIDGRQPSPYVKTYLLPDKTKRSKRRTNARRGTCNPSFGTQPLVYPDLTSDELEMRTLQVSVWHSVALGANLFLGQALVPMEQCDQIFSGGKHWLPLRDRHTSPGGVSLPTLMYQGEIAVSIRFEADNKSEESDNNDEARGRLEIWVRSCRKLASAAGGAATLNVSPYVKCYLLPSRHQASKRKSKVVKANPNPEFNAMLTYNGVTRRELRDRSIELTVWDHVLLGRNDFLGGVRLNIGDTARYSWMDARGHEQTLWTGMLSNPSKWIDASLILRPNMDPQATHIAQ
ncbi:hypothetical protein BOX15_Mlig000854g3, partial [Macrostomum lignano]